MTMIKIGNMELPLDQIIEIQMQASIISQSGQDQISEYIRNQNLARKGKTSQRGYNMSINLTGEFIQWEWQTKRGTFPKRMGKYLYDTYEIVLDQTQLAHIGQLARSNSTDTDKYYMDITQKIDWNDGDFGDEGSCFWGGRGGALKMLTNNGAYAVRFYKKNERFGLPMSIWDQGLTDTREYLGFARCWFVKDYIGDDKEVAILFNGYGLTVLQIVHIMSEYTGRYYRKIQLTNNNEDTGELWIGARNSENHGSGYIMGDQLDIVKISEFDFGWEEESDSYECDNCGRRIDEDSIYNYGDFTYCERCWDREFSYCNCCDESYPNDDMNSTYNGDYVCSNCYDEYYTECDRCGEHYSNDNMIDIEGHGTYCPSCSDHFANCGNCEEWFKIEDVKLRRIGGENILLCDDCYEIKLEEELKEEEV